MCPGGQKSAKAVKKYDLNQRSAHISLYFFQQLPFGPMTMIFSKNKKCLNRLVRRAFELILASFCIIFQAVLFSILLIFNFQFSIFRRKKGPCGHAHTQTKVVDTKMNDNLHICSQQSVNKTANIC